MDAGSGGSGEGDRRYDARGSAKGLSGPTGYINMHPYGSACLCDGTGRNLTLPNTIYGN